jgi:hypothetical protein
MRKVFVSYARADKLFVARLCEALTAAGADVWVDLEELSPGADWLAGIDRGVEGADALAFVISPDSLASEICRHELEHAVARAKRIIPLLRREPNGQPVPDELVRRRWISVREGDDFNVAVRSLVSAL